MVAGPSNADKIRNAAIMYGTGSKQHKQAMARFGGGAKKSSSGLKAAKGGSGRGQRRDWHGRYA